MSLLSVTVKKARYVGIQATQFNTYVTLKLQNVKSTTVTVKGPTPCWEQDFLFEINDINLGLLVEVWNKGVIWDRALGYHYLPLTSVAYHEQECGGRWVELEAQLMMRGGAVVGTNGPTGHALLLDCRFEPPFDAEGTGGADLQRKLDLLNGALDAERAEQARRQLQYVAHSGYSEDSDYTSDLNFPVGQHANCSASQFRSAAHQMHTPQRSLEASRDNSYERDEYHLHADTDPLYYNSQPRTNRIETWSLHAQASVESAISWRTAADWQSGEEQRRPSLERQNTLYDDSIGYGYETYTTSTHIRDHSHISQQASYEEFYDSRSYPYPYDSQWDGSYLYDECGLTPTEYENIVNKRRSSVVQLPQMPPKQLPPSSRYSDYNEMAPYRPRPRRTAASLPATPSSTPKRGRALPVPPGSEASWGRRGRRLPRPPAVKAATRLPAPAPQPQPQPQAMHTHVPYIQEPERTVPEVSYGYDSYGYQSRYQDTASEQYQDTNYSTSYDEDGMQPFFDETPHATPPAATAQKTTWAETETTTQFSYPVKSEEESVIPKSVTSKILAFIQPAVTTKQETYQEKSYQTQYDESKQNQKLDSQDDSYRIVHNNFIDKKTDTSYKFDNQYKIDNDFQQNEHNQQYQLKSDQNEYQIQQGTYSEQLDHKYFDEKQYEQEQQYQEDEQYHQTEYNQSEQYGQDHQYNLNQQYNQDQQYNQEQQYYKELQYNQDLEFKEDQQYNQDQQYPLDHQYHQDQQYQQDQQYHQDEYQHEKDFQDQQYNQDKQYELEQQYQQDYQLNQQEQYEKQQQDLYDRQQQQQQQQQEQHQHQIQIQQQQQQQQQQQILHNQQLQQQQQQHQQQKPPAQQIQSSVLTGAATFGLFVAGGAKKLGSFFGAAAAAVAAPAQPQPQPTAAPTTIISTQLASTIPTTQFATTTTIPTTSVSEISSAVVTSAPMLPRTPSLKRQESIQRPSVRRTRTLPDAPEDYSGSFDESAYEDEYNKTEIDQTDRDRTSLDRLSLDRASIDRGSIERGSIGRGSIDRGSIDRGSIDRTSLDRASIDRFHDEEYLHDTIHESVEEEEKAKESSTQKVPSPSKIMTQVRKPSVDSYHSQTPSVLDRKTSQSSFVSQHEEKLTIPTSLEEQALDKSKVTFQEERTKYHEVPEEGDRFERQESFDQDVYPDDQEQYPEDTFKEEKFNQERFDESDEQYQEDSVFNDQDRHVDEQMDFHPEQPKLTPKQRWHRAYNKIIMQLNVSTNLSKRMKQIYNYAFTFNFYFYLF